MIEYKTGDILAADAEALVNTVNCVGKSRMNDIDSGLAALADKDWMFPNIAVAHA